LWTPCRSRWIVNLRIALRLSTILSLASVRAKRTMDPVPTGRFKSPTTNLTASAAAFIISAVVVFFFAARGSPLEVKLLFALLMVLFPSMTAFMAMVYSVQFEFSQSVEATSTDMINWLPISPEDYVIGSTLSTIYAISPILALIFGGTFGAAVYTGWLDLWAVGNLMGFMGSLIGAFTLEIVRSLMNRLSQAFFKSRGQFAMITRTVLSLMLLVLIQLLYNMTILMKVASWFSVSIAEAWFIPFLWPSLTVLNYMTSDGAGALFYTGLSVVLTLIVFLAGVKARDMNWVPVPVSYRMRPVELRSLRRGVLGRLGFSPVESAIIRKDFKSLLRRREMLTQFAIPAMITITFLVAQSGLIGGSVPPDQVKYGFFGMMMFSAVTLSMGLSLTCMGQEGGAFSNLRKIPIEPISIIKAKIFYAFLPTLLIVIVVFSMVLFFIGDLVTVLGVFLLGITGILDVIMLSTAIGVYYVDFTEVPRQRFVKWEGSFLAFITLIAIIIAVLSPFLYGMYRPELNLIPHTAFILSEVIAAAIAYVGYRIVVGEMNRLYDSEDL